MRRLHSRLVTIGAITVVLLLASGAVSALPTVFVWGILPAGIGVAVIAVSVYSIVRRGGAAQVLLGMPAILLSAGSLWTLKRMFLDGAWPTYLPYLAIALAAPVAMIQSYLARTR